MLLKLCTWQEVESYLEHRTDIIVPIGSTEQHGPNGLLGTDFIAAEFLAEHAGELSGGMVAPTLTVGSAQHHLAFPGTISVRPTVMVETLVDWISSLARHGFTRIFFVNGHGGNIAPTTTAFTEYYARHSFASPDSAAPALCQLINWWMLPETATLIDQLYGEADGAHATASEISVTQYAYPTAIKAMPSDAPPAPQGCHTDIHDAADFRRQFPDGRIGSDPSRSNPADGERIFSVTARQIAEQFSAFGMERIVTGANRSESFPE